MNEDEEEFQKELARRCNPEWSEKEIQAEADKKVRSQRNYEEELRCWLLRADDLKDDPSWSWCDLCSCAIITCEHCQNSSCNGGGCKEGSKTSGECHNRFMKAIALSWAFSGSLGEVLLPQWHKELREKLEHEYSSTWCEECRSQRLAFALAMIVNREAAEKNRDTFTCEDHPCFFGGNLLVDQFLNSVEKAEAQRDGKSQ